MPYKKPGSGIFARRTTSGLFGDTGQTESIFGSKKKKKKPEKKAKVKKKKAKKVDYGRL
jgi:hypothetical protein